MGQETNPNEANFKAEYRTQDTEYRTAYCGKEYKLFEIKIL